jgi:predicted ATPase
MINKITIKNFKAIQSAAIKLSDLSVFVGNNGSGKSSVIEALQTLQTILIQGISVGFTNRWFGLEKIQNNRANNTKNDILIEFSGKVNNERYTYTVSFNSSPNNDVYFAAHEALLKGKNIIFEIKKQQQELSLPKHSHPFARQIFAYIASWQFLSLIPEEMYFPVRREQSKLSISVSSSGRNLADFFSRLQDNAALFNNVLDKMHYVLPDLDYIGASHDQIRKEVYLWLSESKNQDRLPSWLFSSGTLRILAILAILNSESPPPVVFIEEIENGLDPRTLNLLVEEMRGLLPEHQFVATTHSPYFLDLVALRHIIVAERTNGKTDYYRPDDDDRLNAWKTKFSAGNLYTMNKLSRS